MKNAQQVLDQNLKELKELVFQPDINKLNSKEALGKVYFCIEMINQILKTKD